MIQLDYQTYNRRWGLSGMRFSNWENYAFALGYLANINHYRCNGGLIEVKIEQNDLQGADAKEGRIHFYGYQNYLASVLPDWDNCSSAGNGSITCRMNSNDYIYSLVDDYNFVIQPYIGLTTADVFPPAFGAQQIVWSRLFRYLQHERVENLDDIQEAFLNGFNE